MNSKIWKFLSVCIIVMIVTLSLTGAFHGFATPEKQKIYIAPKDNIFSTKPETPEYMEVGDTFSVNISAADWADPGLWGYELKLGYDNTLINAISAEIPEGHFFTPETSPGIFIVDPGTLKEDFVSFALTCIAPEPGKTGSGVIASVTFEIIQAPPPAAPVSCTLDLYDVTLVDPDATGIPTTAYEVEDGYYEFGPPKPPAYLKVEPGIVAAAEVGDEVVVDVTMKNVTADLRIIGVEWKLQFNTTLLNVKNATEGDFLKEWAEKANEIQDGHGTFFWWMVEDGYILSFSLYYKEPHPPALYPEGSGSLATIKFNVMLIPEETTTSELKLFDVIIVDADGNEVPPHHLEHGQYLVPVMLEDLNADRRINILDMAIFGSAYGSYPGHPRWNPRADLDNNDLVNILDGVKIAKAFKPSVYLSVEPSKSYVDVSDEFSIDIKIHDVGKTIYLIGVQFKLTYDPTVLEVKNCAEGDFFKDWADYANTEDPEDNYGTYFYCIPEDGQVIGFVLYYKEPWPPKVFPEGDGTIATITFHALAEGISDLLLEDVILVNVDLNMIPYLLLEHGQVVVFAG